MFLLLRRVVSFSINCGIYKKSLMRQLE
uniref:Uncharacterized protein n=1 Tax=Amphimedon queenslandica TaxID=400682 RepID=A0A1X7SJG9_AMPQE